ncbi:MAG: YncE family protein, partial [Candidatus Binatia bacterium]
MLSVLMETMTVSLNVLLMVFALMATDAQAQESSALRMVQTIPLPNVEGRIDHMAVDLNGRRLLIAALGNNSVEILDLNAGKHLKSVRGLQEPQGLGFVSEFNKIYVANGKSGACDILDGSSFDRIKSVKFSDDADNIRYDAIGRRV